MIEREDNLRAIEHARAAHLLEVIDGRKAVGVLITDNLFTGQPINDDQAKLMRLYASMIGHLCTRKKAEESLTESNDQLRALTSRLQIIREEERTHISHEIHDELGQALTALKMDVSWLNHKIEGSALNATPEALVARTDTMISLIDSTIKTVRRISTDLRPGVLDDLGLIAALEWQTRDFQDRSGIACSFTTNVDELLIPPDYATASFRIVQEALTNVLRHARASKVSVGITKTNGKRQMFYFDTMFIKDSLVYGNKTHFAKLPIAPIPIKDIVKIELQFRHSLKSKI